MTLPATLQEAVENVLNTTIRAVRFLGGGDINEARCLETGEGKIFLKMNRAPEADRMFATEAYGLDLLRSHGEIRIPRVLDHGKAGSHAFLLLEFIPSGPPGPHFWSVFGRGLAALHQPRRQSFGLDRDNFIGTLPQYNQNKDRWLDFYIEQRMRPQLRLASDQGKLQQRDERQFETLFHRLPQWLKEESPSLIHGDLWNGNYMVSDQGFPVLIDPAVSFAHREMDLAMTRLFGGFPAAFYQAYHEVYPLQAGWEERLELYQLYYLMVHVNLFGGGYIQSVRRILDRYQ